MSVPSRLCRLAGRLRRDRRGLALIEFAFGAPILLAIGLYGIELANLTLMNLRISQAALNLADNASRVGADSTSGSTRQLREVDLIDVLGGLKTYGRAWGLTTQGRVTLSSLETIGGTQRIHWQRCIGVKSGTGYESSYGRTFQSDGVTYDPTAGVNTAASGSDNSASHPGTAAPDGMGDTNAKVTAPNNSGVMFVEINYEYKPLINSYWLPRGSARLHYIASFVVRDNRDFTEIYNPAPAVSDTDKLTCDHHNS